MLPAQDTAAHIVSREWERTSFRYIKRYAQFNSIYQRIRFFLEQGFLLSLFKMHSLKLLAASYLLFTALFRFTICVTPELNTTESTISQNASENFNSSSRFGFSTASISTASASPNVFYQSDELKDYVVYPMKPRMVREVQRRIEEIIGKGSYQTVTTTTRPEYGGVLYWTFEADDDKAQKIREVLGLDARAQYHLANDGS